MYIYLNRMKDIEFTECQLVYCAKEHDLFKSIKQESMIKRSTLDRWMDGKKERMGIKKRRLDKLEEKNGWKKGRKQRWMKEGRK